MHTFFFTNPRDFNAIACDNIFFFFFFYIFATCIAYLYVLREARVILFSIKIILHTFYSFSFLFCSNFPWWNDKYSLYVIDKRYFSQKLYPSSPRVYLKVIFISPMIFRNVFFCYCVAVKMSKEANMTIERKSHGVHQKVC